MIAAGLAGALDDGQADLVAVVEGINHVTLAVADVEGSVAFYVEVLGCRVLATWPAGAYLLAGDL